MKIIATVFAAIFNWLGRYGDLIHAQVDKLELEFLEQRLTLLNDEVESLHERQREELSYFDREQQVKRENFIAQQGIERITKQREFESMTLRAEMLARQVKKLEGRVV